MLTSPRRATIVWVTAACVVFIGAITWLWLADRNALEKSASAASKDVAISNNSGATLTQSSTIPQGNVTLSSANEDRTAGQGSRQSDAAWMQGRTSKDRVKLVARLAASANPDDWMLARFMATECQLVRGYAELPSAIGGENPFEVWLRAEGKLSDREIGAANSLVSNAKNQCEETGKLSQMPFVDGAFKRAKDAGSLLAQMQLPVRSLIGAASWDEIPQNQRVALQRGLADPQTAAAWLTDRLTDLNGQKQFGGALEGLDSREAGAVVLLSTCMIGADCGNQSMQRLHTCSIAFACSGESVDEAINGRFGGKAKDLRNRAVLFTGALAVGDLRDAGLFR